MPALENLDQAPAGALRGLCEGLLDDASAACQRFTRGHDAEALHDFRVALRRLRSQLRAYAPLLPRAAAPRIRRRLRKLARATSEARDLEVQVAWLGRQRAAVGPRNEEALDDLLGGLSRRARRSTRKLQKRAARRFARLRRQLLRRLADDEERAQVAGGWGSFRTAAAQRILVEVGLLSRHAVAIASAGDQAHTHKARIAAKRLRYLVEPLRDSGLREVGVAAEALVLRLRQLQDLLGELHDAHVMSHVVADALSAAAEAAARRDHGPPARLALASGGGPATAAEPTGLSAIDRLVSARRDDLYAGLDSQRHRGVFGSLSSAATVLAGRLRG